MIADCPDFSPNDGSRVGLPANAAHILTTHVGSRVVRIPIQEAKIVRDGQV